MRPWFPLALAGCWTPPDLPLIDTIPLVPEARCAPPREVTVACVLDGDTFDVGACGATGERVRMLGINAPEIAHPPNPAPAECWGDNAATELRRRIEGRRVMLTFDGNCSDIYGRTLAWTWLPDADAAPPEDEEEDEGGAAVRLVNLEMVRDGHARIYGEEFGEVIYQRQLDEARAQAQALGLGLWGACGAGG